MHFVLAVPTSVGGAEICPFEAGMTYNCCPEATCLPPLSFSLC